MPSEWTQPIDGLYLHTTDGKECCSISVNVNSGKLMVLDLTGKPNIRRQCQHEFDTVEEAKAHTKLSPVHHEYGEHKTYTGPGCAQCGKDRSVHPKIGDEANRKSDG